MLHRYTNSIDIRIHDTLTHLNAVQYNVNVDINNGPTLLVSFIQPDESSRPKTYEKGSRYKEEKR
jgi:hypothetical protein